MSDDRPWQLWDTDGLQRSHLTEPRVRELVRLNESTFVFGRHETTDAEIHFHDVENDPLPPGYGEERKGNAPSPRKR